MRVTSRVIWTGCDARQQPIPTKTVQGEGGGNDDGRPGPEALRDVRESVRTIFGVDREKAHGHYSPLVDFVRRVAPPGAPRPRLLDVGCGCGWSTSAFAGAGYEATGIDLNAAAFEPAASEHLDLRPGSATEIPFPAATFDVAVTYSCLEHVPDPGRALLEMERVCKPGGSSASSGRTW
jgi:SAM-dependent methyltransferase